MIKFHPELVGTGPTEALKRAHKQGLHLDFSDQNYCFVPGRVYVTLKDGLIAEAFELIDPKLDGSHEP